MNATTLMVFKTITPLDLFTHR